MGEIHIKGVRQHNLKDVEVRIPRDKLTVITGVSGSGKSSLAFGVVPEPTTYAMLAGAAGLGLVMLRLRRQS